MIDTILTSLILMAVSGLTFIAYKHHEAYFKIYKIIIVLYCLVTFIIVTWDIAVSITNDRLNKFLQSDKIEISKEIVDNLQISAAWTSIIGLSVVIYFGLLLFLPNIIKHRDEKEPK